MSKRDSTLAALAASPEISVDAKKAARSALASPAHGGAKLRKRKPATKQVGFRISLESADALAEARIQDRITATTRVQALLDLWQEDSELAGRVAKRATELLEDNWSTR